MIPSNRRAWAYGLFTAGYGVAWFLGSAAIGILYDTSITGLIVFCVVLQLAALPIFAVVRLSRRDSPIEKTVERGASAQ